MGEEEPSKVRVNVEGRCMAQEATVLAAKSDDLSSILGAIWWKERTSSFKLSSDLSQTHK